ncbi:MAG TPA: recombinase family protein [Candidatus Sulfopaludibacter sp.]|jgi:site-specific DNA recombinase|nr:recombinase family protein [Candidatus Sulfopaludibacter sp.]
MAVAVYVRVSTEEQRERQSIVTQREFADRFCALHQHNVFRVYADDGVTGTIPIDRRPAGIDLLRDARGKHFDQILVYRLDRLGRDTRLILNAVAEFEKCGVRVKSMTEEFDTSSATGRLMLTLLSGFAAHERDVIRERSVAGTNRKAEAGVWLGGIVPYGYVKKGERGQLRIAVNNDPIPGLDVSEADVVRTIYRMSADERQSCQRIADHLNRICVPCGSVENAKVKPGRRARRVASVWRPGYIRNMIVNRTYMGEHLFGKRSKSGRMPIARPVPAIVSEMQWQTAQEVLRSNRVIPFRKRKDPYLLRGLIKCGLCGLTFSGWQKNAPGEGHYYRCNGRAQARCIYGRTGRKCSAKSLNGDYVECLVWADIESFLRNPVEIIGKLRERLAQQNSDQPRKQKELESFLGRLSEKTAERDRVLGLFRRGRIDDATLDQQLDVINAESGALQAEIELRSRALSAVDEAAQIRSVEELLARLHKRLDGSIAPEHKHRIVESLVESIQANTVEKWGVQQSELVITYRFSEPAESAALEVPRFHRLNVHNQPPEQLITLGDHLRRRRLVLKLLQKQVAQQIGVCKSSIANWEKNRGEPEFEHVPAVIRFLGYNPLPPADGWGPRLVQGRTILGISQKESARRIGVDPGTLARWERGERVPAGDYAARANRFLATIDAMYATANAKRA